MINVHTDLIEEAVYNLCIRANTLYDNHLYNTLLSMYEQSSDSDKKNKLLNILKNIKLASDTNRPLCQDTGQVIIFLELGQNLLIHGILLKDAINNAVKRAYIDNYYRKSVVENSLFNRTNSNTNTPVIIYTDIIEGDSININLLIKGAGSENYSTLKMFKPTASKEEIFEFIKQSVITAGEKSCPPLVLGLGIGSTMDGASVLSKKAFFNSMTQDEQVFSNSLKDYLNASGQEILDVKLCSAATHIACLPVALTINCHSTRHAGCVIKNSKIIFDEIKKDYKAIEDKDCHCRRVDTDNIEAIRSLQAGEKILLSGVIYTARDAAHKKISEFYKNNSNFPFSLKDKIIFYAGPCPAAPNEVIGPVGPTTSARMDTYCDLLYSNGLLATIGKGERSNEALDSIKKYKGKYLTAQGGISCLLAKCVKEAEVVAFEELGTEAVRKLVVKDFPLTVEI